MTPKHAGPALVLPVGVRDHAQGSAHAAATLVEYGDYECPHCGRAYPIVKAVQKKLGARLRFVFRNFPITEIHPHAASAAAAAEAAALQGRFWEMHDVLFHRQQALEDDDLRRYASELGLDVARFERDRVDDSVLRRVARDMRSGIASGQVLGTPTLFIDGAVHGGAYDAPGLIEALIHG